MTNWRKENCPDQIHPNILSRKGASRTIFFFKEKERLTFNSTKKFKRRSSESKEDKRGFEEEKGGNTRQTQKKRQ